MPQPTEQPPTTPPRRLVGLGSLLLLAAALFAGLSTLMWWQEHRALAALDLSDQLDAAGKVRPLAEVSRAVKAMQLVSVVLETTVATESTDESWRGDVTAKVRAPVRYFYGSDLSTIGRDAVRLDPFGKAMVIVVPRPKRLATEVLGEAETSEVQAGWLRLRSLAGEYHLGLARRGLHEAAQRMMLKPEDAQMIEDATRDRITELVKAVAGERTDVLVMFRDEDAVTEAKP